MKKYLTFFLPVLLLSGISILGYFRILCDYRLYDSYLYLISIIVVVLYFLWIIYEFKISKTDLKQNKKISDFGTRELYGLSQFLTITSALFFGSAWNKIVISHIIGMIIFMSGVIFRIWAINTLGKYYSHMVRKIDQHKIVKTGPYRFIRHPAYSGMIVAHTGIVLIFYNYFTLTILVFLLLPAVIFRILIEERTLIDISGYKEFSENRKRLLPYIW